MMGLMKLISSSRKPTKAESEDVMRDAPWIVRPPGPRHTDLAPACPVRASICSLDALRRQSHVVWVAVNTYHRGYTGPVYGRWYSRRGAIFLHARAYFREAKIRADLSGTTFINTPLYVPDYVPILTPTSEGQFLVPPADAPRVAPLDAQGRLTKEGFERLEDTEFVWPWLDQPAPTHLLPRDLHGKTELELGLMFERAWPAHWYGQDAEGREPAIGEAPTFALAYAELLKETGRVGPGTRLGKWLDAWLERAARELRRIQG